MASERQEHQAVRLADGRLLGFAEHGDPAGRPVLHFHREVGSRLLGRAFDADARRLGSRVLTPDRPGLGFSDFQPGRTIVDWAADVLELAGQLGLERFAVLGVSGGAPYALACAWKLPERITATVLAGTILPEAMVEHDPDTSPMQRVLSRSALWAPWTLRPVMTLLGEVSKRAPEQALRRMEEAAEGPDRAVFARPEIRTLLTQSLAETFRSGPRGAAHDLRLTTGEWGIPFQEVSTAVDLWHGDADGEITPGSARRLADALPHGAFHLVPGGGHHLSLSHPGPLLDALGP